MDDLSNDLNNAISRAIQAAGGEMVVNWVTVIEIVDPDGERAVHLQTQPGSKSWDSLGLLTFALHTEQAGAVRDALAP